MNKGFSLVELIVVIAIMAILVGVAVPVYTSYITKANEASDIQAIDNLEHACEIVGIEYNVKITFEGDTNAVKATVAAGAKKTEAIAQLKLILGDAATEANGVFTVTLNTTPVNYTATPSDAQKGKPMVPNTINSTVAD